MTIPNTESYQTPTILVVDDSHEANRVLCVLLGHEGFLVKSAYGGEEAIEMILDDPPDLVLLDVMMPEVDGLEVLRQVRQHPETVELPVIMVTALGDTQDVIQGLELGANDYLTKPPQFEILAARVRTQLKLKALQDQRRQDILRLRELDALKDKFLQIAAHDLRNPLNNIVMSAELLDEHKEEFAQIDPEFKRILKMVRMAIRMMQSIINDFLDLRAMESGQLELQREQTSLNYVLEQALLQFGSYAEQKEVDVRSDLADNLPDCFADPDRLMQIASNLIGNAIKYSHLGGSVVVTSRLHDGCLRVEVQDDGPGIPEEEMPLLFTPFSRLSNKPTGGEKSSGVGLSIARHLVELHQGTIGAESEAGIGSTFWFEIPACVEGQSLENGE
ncbi:MAG: hybrid sensor histidine kinase/response regulator [Chloroflexota bacterium]